MRKIRRYFLPIFIPIFTLIYGIGDYFEWWDGLTGRRVAQLGWERLATNEGFPKIIIFDDEHEFHPLLKVIRNRTKNKEINIRLRNSIKPTSIARLGGTLQPDVGDKLPEGWSNPRFAPDSSPIVCFYNYSREASMKGRILTINDALPVGNLGDVRKWIEDSKNRERFLVTVILIGLLSIVVVIMDITKASK